MSIKGKLIASLVIEVLVIFLLTEFVYRDISRYLQLKKVEDAGKNYLYALNSAIAILESGSSIDKNSFAIQLRNSTSYIPENEYGKVLKGIISDAYNSISTGDTESLISFRDRLRSFLDQIEKKSENALNKGITVLVLIPLFSLIIIGIGAYTTYRSVIYPVKKMLEAISKVRNGDLTAKIYIGKRDELGDLGKEFDTLIDWIRSTFIQINSMTEDISKSSTVLLTDLTATKDKNIAMQKKVLQLAFSSEILSISVDNVNRHVHNVYSTVRTVEEKAVQGSDIIFSSIEEVKKLTGEVVALRSNVEILTDQSEKIQEVVGAIKSIAEQTNLLALNAAIEAARAGEAGKGFAVVADEVRQLAIKTKRATEEIEDIVDDISNSMKSLARQLQEKSKRASEVQKSMEMSSETIDEIKSSIQVITEIAGEISELMEEQRESLNVVKEEVISVSEYIDRFGAIFKELEDSSITAEKAIDSMMERLFEFNIGEVVKIDRGRILFMSWLLSLPNMVEKNEPVRIGETEFFSWLNTEFKKFIEKKGFHQYYEEIMGIIEDIDSVVEELFGEKVSSSEKDKIYRIIKDKSISLLEIFNRIKKELEGK
ncbi:methyl-accepting chemotaxis protein [Persephonella hydrogeniphila]|uniref:Methyl-accepting chemotaxis protein n=1 Tax=Persephonella hydrogeniphila TaxID=198703 RepID=A0A285NF57_9AQUI|nr:methyl-accepting chemotaxis protein [Persephonella hydrogeniphila]SNZ08144.1 methyl-accepting chemotaxis protein [Persephonella hydrogeniphila]